MLHCHCGETDPKKLTITEDAVLCEKCLEARDAHKIRIVNNTGTIIASWATEKQSTPGTAVNPSLFPRWLDGSCVIDIKNVPETMPHHYNLMEEIRKSQSQKITIAYEPRKH